ncbi:MAG: response regulator transcription factor [Thermoleophilia bacterium]
MRVLVVEDEARVASFIASGLEGAGYATEVVASGREAVDRILAEPGFDLVLLDVGLPDKDGFAVLADVRTVDRTTPIIMLTARGDVPSRVKGLDLGADDYLPKPFDFEELLARMRAALRQARQPASFALEAGDLSLDLKTRQATRAGSRVDLTSREFALLEFFLRHPGQVLSRSQILNGVWGYDFDPGSNVVDVYVGYLRAKLDREGEPSVIETVRGGGYRLRPGGEGAG